MQPDFTLLADRQNITDRIRDRLLSLRITDEAGTLSDTIEMQLDDRDGRIEWPRHGAELEVWLGYRHSNLSRMGRYIVDEVEHSAPPSTLTVRAKAADMRASLKAPKTRSWDAITLGDVVATLAAEHSLIPKVSEEFATLHHQHIDQTEESDLHLLTRLAREYGAVAKPAAGFLLFVKKGEAKAASGKDLPTINVATTDIIRHRMTQADRGKYQSVRAYWHETKDAERSPVLVGNGEPIYTLRHPYPDIEQATHAATAKLESLQRGTATLNLTLMGNTDLRAEGKLLLADIRASVDGLWLVQRAEHRLDGQGFTTQVECEVPND